MNVEQFVMAYGVEQDRLRAILPEGFISLRPVVRINAEIRDGETGYLECNTAVEHEGKRGWLNIAHWKDVPFTRAGKTVRFHPDFLTIAFTPVGVEGGCPAERDNDGCFFLDDPPNCVPRSPSPPTRNSATAPSPGTSPPATPRVRVREKPSRPFPRRRSESIPRNPAP